ncbi:MAG: hypothetical protein VB034_07680, partial [Eubacteriales bacterium]|nr:hypothetical protein [Eubacteriales bacterium]
KMNLERNRAERRNKKKVSILYRGIPYLIFAALAAGYLAGVPGAAATAAITQASHMTATFVSRRELFIPFGAGLIGRTNASAAAQDKLPSFTYTGTYTLLDDGDGNWRIKFLTSGTLTLEKSTTIDLFLVGGGGGGGNSVSYNSSGGGGGGYTVTHKGIVLVGGTQYSVVVGAGGGAASSGGTTWFANSNLYYAAGGNGGGYAGGNGGSGGGGGAGQSGSPGNGGTDGANGTSGYHGAGTGQGTTTREFGESTSDLYAGGGRGAARGWGFGSYGTGYYGRGGSGVAESGNGESGIAGIAVIRNQRAA